MLDLTPTVTVGNLIQSIDTVTRTTIADYLVPASEGLQLLAGARDDLNQWEAASPDIGRRIIDLLGATHC
jgi:hypothetical protein